MANLIIFEGLERCGKGSIINLLNQKITYKKIEAEAKQPVTIPYDHLGILYEGMHQFAAQLYKNLPGETFLIDRYFISEFVYSQQFQRNSYMTKDYIQDLCDNNKVIVFYLKNTHQDYLDRGPKNKITLTEEQYGHMQDLFAINIVSIKSSVDNIKIHEINTTNKSIENVYAEIKSILNEK